MAAGKLPGPRGRELERIRYRDMLEQFLISGEVYADLMSQLQSRWSHIDRTRRWTSS